MLEHVKFVLKAVSDQKNLFRKELLKSKRWLNKTEQLELFNWLKNNFYFTHQNIIREVFDQEFLKEGA